MKDALLLAREQDRLGVTEREPRYGLLQPLHEAEPTVRATRVCSTRAAHQLGLCAAVHLVRAHDPTGRRTLARRTAGISSATSSSLQGTLVGESSVT